MAQWRLACLGPSKAHGPGQGPLPSRGRGLPAPGVLAQVAQGVAGGWMTARLPRLPSSQGDWQETREFLGAADTPLQKQPDPSPRCAHPPGPVLRPLSPAAPGQLCGRQSAGLAAPTNHVPGPALAGSSPLMVPPPPGSGAWGPACPGSHGDPPEPRVHGLGWDGGGLGGAQVVCPGVGRARSPGLAVKLVSAALGSATPSVPRGSEHTGTLGSSPRAQGTPGTAAWRCQPRAVWSGRASFLAAAPGGAV